jgi:hypothetical protein
LLDAIAAGAIGPELRAHADACDSCRELFVVASAVVDDRATLMRSATPPSAGLLWWRMSLREKRETARAAVRTGSFIQFALIAGALAVALAILGISVDVHAVVQAIAASLHASSLPLIALAAWLILAPVAVYFAVTEQKR